jgi:hypothetical protein
VVETTEVVVVRNVGISWNDCGCGLGTGCCWWSMKRRWNTPKTYIRGKETMPRPRESVTCTGMNDMASPATRLPGIVIAPGTESVVQALAISYL